MEANDKTGKEKHVGRALAFSFEGHWMSLSGRSASESYAPEYCQQIVDFAVACLDDQFSDPKAKVAPPHLSAFARSIGTSTKRIEEWVDLFADFKEAVAVFTDIQREMLLNGGLLGGYSADITKLLLSHSHGFKEKADVQVVGLIPYSAAQSVNYLLEQQGLKPLKLPDVQDAEVIERTGEETVAEKFRKKLEQ